MNKDIFVYVCQLCKAKVKAGGKVYRVPGFKMGSMVFERVACKSCLDKFCESMKENLDKLKKEGSPECCCGCGCDLTKESKVCNVQSSLNDDGTWGFSTVCEHCFDHYCECCKQAA